MKDQVMKQVAMTTAYIGSRRSTETPELYERVSTNEYDDVLLERYYHTALDEAKPWLRWHPSAATLIDFLTERVVWRWLLSVWPEEAPLHEQRSEELLLQLKQQANLRRTRKCRRKMNPF